jgi:hypothetical protein
MVALSIGAARAAREEAQRLRVDSLGLRVAAKENLRLASAGKGRAEAAAARASRVIPLASPWSRLEWLREDDALSQVLVLVD